MARPRSAGLSGPGKQGRDDDGAFWHMVRNLELQVRESDLGGREDLRAVVEVTGRALRGAGAPARDRVGGEAPLCGVAAEQPGGGVQAGGRKLDCQPARVPGTDG